MGPGLWRRDVSDLFSRLGIEIISKILAFCKDQVSVNRIECKALQAIAEDRWRSI